VHELLPLQKRRTVPERAVAGAQHAVDSTVAELAALASGQKAPAPAKAAALRRQLVKVRKTPSWPRSWANFNFLSLYPRGNVWANLTPFSLKEQRKMTAAAVANAPDPVVEGAPVDVAAMVAENRRLMAENARLEARCNWPALCAARLYTDPALQEGLQAMTGVKTLDEFSSLLGTRRAQFPFGSRLYRGLESIPDEELESALEAHCKRAVPAPAAQCPWVDCSVGDPTSTVVDDYPDDENDSD
jgi:hypothetical protein